MSKPLDEDFNYMTKSSITEGGVTFAHPKQAKGGTFAPADMPVLKAALYHYKEFLVKNEVSERDTSEELSKVANLLHRIGRIG